MQKTKLTLPERIAFKTNASPVTNLPARLARPNKFNNFAYFASPKSSLRAA